MADKFKGNMAAFPQFYVDKFKNRMEGGMSLREHIAIQVFVDRVRDGERAGVPLRVLAQESCIAADTLIEVMDETKPTMEIPPPTLEVKVAEVASVPPVQAEPLNV